MTKSNSPDANAAGMIDRTGNIGSGATISGTVNQQYNIGSSGTKGKWYLTKDVLIPVIVGLTTTVGSVVVKNWLDLTFAPQHTVANTRTLVAMSDEVVALASQKAVSPELMAKLKEIADQARAVEAAAALIADKSQGTAQRADFWLRPGGGGIRLGDDLSFGVRSVDGNGVLNVTVNNTSPTLSSGGMVKYTFRNNQCFATYVAKSPDAMLIGFNVSCVDSARKP